MIDKTQAEQYVSKCLADETKLYQDWYNTFYPPGAVLGQLNLSRLFCHLAPLKSDLNNGLKNGKKRCSTKFVMNGNILRKKASLKKNKRSLII